MRILLAEDEKSLARALKIILEHNNFSVDTVYDGADATDYLLNGNYDAAILDIMMPKKDGLSVLKDLRTYNKTMPVLLLTARNEVNDRVKGLDLGADDYLGKPFNAQELLARLRAMLRRVSSPSKGTLEFKDLKLDRSTYEMSGPKGSIRLANREYQMLEMLLLANGRPISADVFMEKVWGYDSEAEINVVWTYLSYLRRKFTSVGSEVNIKANRGIGYYLD